MKRILIVVLSLALHQPVLAESDSDVLVNKIWDAIKVFEGSPTSIASDFDCQGMSIGVAQWNIGKSFNAFARMPHLTPAPGEVLRMS